MGKIISFKSLIFEFYEQNLMLSLNVAVLKNIEHIRDVCFYQIIFRMTFFYPFTTNFTVNEKLKYIYTQTHTQVISGGLLSITDV